QGHPRRRPNWGRARMQERQLQSQFARQKIDQGEADESRYSGETSTRHWVASRAQCYSYGARSTRYVPKGWLVNTYVERQSDSPTTKCEFALRAKARACPDRNRMGIS